MLAGETDKPEGEQISWGHHDKQLVNQGCQRPEDLSVVCPQHPNGSGSSFSLSSSNPWQDLLTTPVSGHSLCEGWETKGKMVQNCGPFCFFRR